MSLFKHWIKNRSGEFTRPLTYIQLLKNLEEAWDEGRKTKTIGFCADPDGSLSFLEELATECQEIIDSDAWYNNNAKEAAAEFQMAILNLMLAIQKGFWGE